MSPIESRVFVAEDDPGWQDIVKDLLKSEGHRVVLTANDRLHALAAVSRLDELRIDVAVIDGNLNSYESSGKDGKDVLAAIRAQAPGVKTVGISGNDIPGVDVNVGKDKIEKIGKIVTKL